MQKINLLIVISLFSLITACATSTTPNLDEKFGEALNESKQAMKIAPKNTNSLPSHIELIQPLERYQRQDAKMLATPVTAR